MNEKLCVDQSKKEALKCLTGGEAPSLKELLSEEALANVGRSLINLESNATSLFFFILFPLS